MHLQLLLPFHPQTGRRILNRLGLWVLIAGMSTCLSAKTVTLTDTQGRSLEATILSMVGDSVNVQLANMRQFKIPLSKLDDASRKRVNDWVVEEIRGHREPFKISIQNFKENMKESKSASTKIKTYDEGYTVEIENQMTMPVSGLKVEYLILKEGAVLAAQSNKAVDKEVLKGKADLVDMGLRGTSTFRTATMPIVENRLRGGWSYVGGGNENAVDELGGIWIKILSGDTVVFEYARPSVLPDKVPWDPPKK